MNKSVANGASMTQGNSAGITGKTQRDSGFPIRQVTHWELTGVIPSQLYA